VGETRVYVEAAKKSLNPSKLGYLDSLRQRNTGPRKYHPLNCSYAPTTIARK